MENSFALNLPDPGRLCDPELAARTCLFRPAYFTRVQVPPSRQMPMTQP
jgi:hypothetical protein